MTCEKESWEYDERNNLISYTDTDGRKELWEYDNDEIIEIFENN